MSRLSALRPLRLTPVLEVWPPVVLAPMAGVTNSPFRRLCRRFGGGLYVSEMVTARALVEGNERTRDMVQFDQDESPRSIQLYGVDPATIGEAVRILVGDGAVDHVDLNFGCPVAKVTRKGGGAALPVHHRLLARIIAAAVGAAAPEGVPVTVKFRMGVDRQHLDFLRTGRIAQEQGAAAVALHARTAEQQYSGHADWNAIGALKEAVTLIPVLGNGDILEAADAVSMVEATGCDGVVVGRGCLGRPWLFADLSEAFGRVGPEPEREAAAAAAAPAGWPDLAGVVRIMGEHADLLVRHFGEAAGLRDFRKHTGWYLAGFAVGSDLRRSLNQVATRPQLEDLLAEAVERAGADAPFPAHAVRQWRGHTHGPRRVAVPDGWFDSVDDPRPPRGAELLVSGG